MSTQATGEALQEVAQVAQVAQAVLAQAVITPPFLLSSPRRNPGIGS